MCCKFMNTYDLAIEGSVPLGSIGKVPDRGGHGGMRRHFHRNPPRRPSREVSFAFTAPAFHRYESKNLQRVHLGHEWGLWAPSTLSMPRWPWVAPSCVPGSRSKCRFRAFSVVPFRSALASYAYLRRIEPVAVQMRRFYLPRGRHAPPAMAGNSRASGGPLSRRQTCPISSTRRSVSLVWHMASNRGAGYLSKGANVGPQGAGAAPQNSRVHLAVQRHPIHLLCTRNLPFRHLQCTCGPYGLFFGALRPLGGVRILVSHGWHPPVLRTLLEIGSLGLQTIPISVLDPFMRYKGDLGGFHASLACLMSLPRGAWGPHKFAISKYSGKILQSSPKIVQTHCKLPKYYGKVVLHANILCRNLIVWERASPGEIW